MNVLPMKVSAYHMVDGLGSGLYEDEGQRISELIRNGVYASMPDPERRWEPKLAKIEISLVSTHPLSPNRGPALIVLDHGQGITDVGLDRYFNWLGTPLSHLKQHTATFSGASQKGIGRLAALALNKNCLSGDIMQRISHGYYLLSRTAPRGVVRFVHVIPKKVELEGGFVTDRFIEPTATEMGPLKGIAGTFTAVVIPTPIFDNPNDIYEALKWKLPRERDKMFQLLLNGKAVDPPPLMDMLSVTSPDGRYRARLGKTNKGEEGGVHLCDSNNGLRVAECTKRLVPEPLWFPDLVGDIFAPGLLRHQNTARSGLTPEFVRSKEWTNIRMWLIRDVASAAQKLYERDAIDTDASEVLDDLVEQFRKVYGDPEMEKHKPRAQAPTPQPDPLGAKTVEPDKKPDEQEEKEKRKYRRYVSIRVRGETYNLFRGLSLHPFIYAQVERSDSHVIAVNVRGAYKALPKRKEARNEHCLNQLLSVIGKSKYPNDEYQATIYANERRSEFP